MLYGGRRANDLYNLVTNLAKITNLANYLGSDWIGTSFGAGWIVANKAASIGDYTLLPDVLKPLRCCMPVDRQSTISNISC